ncbi:MAG TPA: lipid A-modifier LpxR family protein [Puia sp.]|uniref:lipid A-modifier LpxR family protein n=1 Tax=Puia sp. TaxID=2045100 RepID=UPI002BE15984|nr:lipid A-modifier LpxR family protein [Puia sp.]HVU96657.1 lipid A-modifier LpxR family protein [Puia sp.]
MMRSLLFSLLLSGLAAAPVRSLAQAPFAVRKDSVTRILRIYEDNDGINIFGQSTDDAYTNGTRIDLFYQPAHRPHGLLGRFAPHAGDSSIDIYGWGVMQLMYTPMDISKSNFQSHDYPYSGAIVATHTRYSYNPVKKYDWQTELVIGALGPLSLAHQTQSVIHHLTGFIQPMGWGTQFRNDLLLNVNLTAEKQLAESGGTLRIIGGAQLYAGTMQNGAAIYPLILLGKMNPYFDGFFSQYTAGYDAAGHKRWQLYFFAKPQLQYLLTNALLEGGIFTGNPNLQAPDKPSAQNRQQSSAASSPPPPSIPALQHWVPSLAYGGVLSNGNFSITLTQNVSSATLKGLYCHDWGNISLYFGW